MRNSRKSSTKDAKVRTFRERLEVSRKEVAIEVASTIPRRWSHRNGGWTCSDDLGEVWIQGENPKYKYFGGLLAAAFCLGERYVHWHYGFDSHCLLMGCHIDNWHGMNFGYDLKQAIEWLQDAEYKEWEYLAWGKHPLEE
jgi:hypothetical protein